MCNNSVEFPSAEHGTIYGIGLFLECGLSVIQHFKKDDSAYPFSMPHIGVHGFGQDVGALKFQIDNKVNMGTLFDRWIKHFKIDRSELIIFHDDGELRLPIEAISSHKHVSFASLVIRRFSGHRDEIAITRFRADEISKLLSTLRDIESQNHKKKADV